MSINSDVLFMKEDNDRLIFAEEDTCISYQADSKWKVMIIDDEQEVHSITRLVLNKFEFEGKSLQFISGFSGDEAKKLLRENPDTALILLDVVMEEEDTGLQIVKYIRKELKNNLVRIILRTGQSEQSPEEKVIIDYDINDYKSKTELTSQKLFSTVVSALRSFRDLTTIDTNRKSLKKVIDLFGKIFEIRSIKEFAAAVLTNLISILASNEDSVYNTSGFVATNSDDTFYIVSGVGHYGRNINKKIEDAVNEETLVLLNRAKEAKQNIYHNKQVVIYLNSKTGSDSLLYIEGCKALSELDKDLMNIFCNNISAINEAIISTSRYESERQQWLLSETLRQLNRNLTSTLEPREVLKRLLESLSQTVSYDSAIATLKTNNGFEVFIKRGRTFWNGKHDWYNESYENELISEIVVTGLPILIKDINKNFSNIGSYLKEHSENVRSILGVPIIYKKELFGVVLLKSDKANAFNTKEENLVFTFTEQAAIAIKNAYLFSEVKQLAITDELTGLYNRRHFFELAEYEFRHAKQYNHPLSLMVIDLDNFKKVNDNYGHATGDEVLKFVANQCREALWETDIHGRYGGEEFLALLPGVINPMDAAELLRQSIENQPIPTPKYGDMFITISIGVAMMKEDDSDIESIFERADAAMYQAKQKNKNCVVLSK